MKHELAVLQTCLKLKVFSCYIKNSIFNGRIHIAFIVNNLGLD